MARNCPKAEIKEGEATPVKNVRGIKGPDTRQMKDHPLYLKAWLEKKGVQFLIDTGCERSVTPRKFIGDSRLEPAECRLFAANGTVINVVSEVVMNVKIGEWVLPTRFVVSDNITEPMLGVDWLRGNRMIWDFAKDILMINGQVFHLIPGEKSDSCRRVVAAEKVVVPARSQAIVPGRVEMTRMTSDANDGHSVWTTEVSELRNGVNVARAILPERLDNLPILVLNSSDQACEIHADTILTELSLAQCTNENNEEILTSPEGEHSYLYLHLSKLLDGIDNDVSDNQRSELIKTLREYADVFSKCGLDLGETSLAAHQIDTGYARPMRQTLRRQPHHLFDKIDENVQDMLKAGVIEHSCIPWTSNLVVVAKKDGSLRFLRRLSQIK